MGVRRVRNAEVRVQLPVAPPIFGSVVQLGERLICIQEVAGSTPVGSTRSVLPSRL